MNNNIIDGLNINIDLRHINQKWRSVDGACLNAFATLSVWVGREITGLVIQLLLLLLLCCQAV